jgi:hypothetical protein
VGIRRPHVPVFERAVVDSFSFTVALARDNCDSVGWERPPDLTVFSTIPLFVSSDPDVDALVRGFAFAGAAPLAVVSVPFELELEARGRLEDVSGRDTVLLTRCLCFGSSGATSGIRILRGPVEGSCGAVTRICFCGRRGPLAEAALVEAPPRAGNDAIVCICGRRGAVCLASKDG